jgi:hypothetical protein
MKDFETIFFTEEQRKRFRSGELVTEWADMYKEIFDDDDLRIASKKNKESSYHFFEWLAAVIIYSTTGYLSLVEKYQFTKSHPRKKDILRKLFSSEIIAKLRARRIQCPDLLCYSPDFKDCFFCEAKGLSDKMRPAQEKRFQEIEDATGKEVYIIEFKKAVIR